MTNLIKINNTEIQVKEYQGKRVCTFKDIDACHSKSEGQTRVAFNRHRKHFLPNEDYFVLNRYEAEKQGFTAPNGIIYITESGYLMITKTFEDDLAWEVQRQLVNNYFRPKAVNTLDTEYLRIRGLCIECRTKKEYFRKLCTQYELEFKKWAGLEAQAMDAGRYLFNMKRETEALQNSLKELNDMLRNTNSENFLE